MLPEKKWNEKSVKEKLDLIFVCIAIVTFSLSIYTQLYELKKK